MTTNPTRRKKATPIPLQPVNVRAEREKLRRRMAIAMIVKRDRRSSSK